MNNVAVTKGALQLALNVLRTRHNDEVADELQAACTDIPDDINKLIAENNFLKRDNQNVREELKRRDAIYSSGTIVLSNDQYSKMWEHQRDLITICQQFRDTILRSDPNELNNDQVNTVLSTYDDMISNVIDQVLRDKL